VLGVFGCGGLNPDEVEAAKVSIRKKLTRRAR